MQKRSKLEVEGYLHDVSKPMEGRNRHRYFTATLQEASRNSRVVVFDVQRHYMFENAQKDRTPVRLSDVGLSPSRQKTGEMDVLVNTTSSLTCVRNLEFAFHECLSEVVQDWTLDQIVQNPREYQKVNVTVKVIQLSEDVPGMTRSNQRLQRRSYDVADQTCGLCLTVWGGALLETGKWYTVKNASVRQFDGCITLSTTTQSSLMIVPDVSRTVGQVIDHFKVQEGEVVTAEVKADYLCPKMHPLPAVNFQTLMARCPQCAAYCKTTKVTSVLSATVTIQDQSNQMSTFTIGDFVLRELLSVELNSRVEPDDLVAKLLIHDCGRLQIKYRGQRVIAASFLLDAEAEGKDVSLVSEKGKGPGCESANEASEAGGSDTVICDPMLQGATEDMCDDFLLDDFFTPGLEEKAEGACSVNQPCEGHGKDVGLEEKAETGSSESGNQPCEGHGKDVSVGLEAKGRGGAKTNKKSTVGPNQQGAKRGTKK